MHPGSTDLDAIRGRSRRARFVHSMTSRIPGFYRLPPERRLTALEQHRRILGSDMAVYRSAGLTVALDSICAFMESEASQNEWTTAQREAFKKGEA